MPAIGIGNDPITQADRQYDTGRDLDRFLSNLLQAAAQRSQTGGAATQPPQMPQPPQTPPQQQKQQGGGPSPTSFTSFMNGGQSSPGSLTNFLQNNPFSSLFSAGGFSEVPGAGYGSASGGAASEAGVLPTAGGLSNAPAGGGGAGVGAGGLFGAGLLAAFLAAMGYTMYHAYSNKGEGHVNVSPEERQRQQQAAMRESALYNQKQGKGDNSD